VIQLSKIRIAIADDHVIVRQGLSSLLNNHRDFEVVGEAADGFELIRLVEKLSPQVVITDFAMPNMNGLEATKQIKKRFPGVQIIILSMHTAASYVVGSLRNGALGYLLKDDGYNDVCQAIHAVLAGKRYLSSQVLEAVLNYISSDNNTNSEPRNLLSEREREVLQLIAEGNTSPQIADKLSISIRTAEKHRANLKAKLVATSQADLVHYAIQQGIVSLKQTWEIVDC
jgi:two-component system, NarL family, response regulator NreC